MNQKAKKAENIVLKFVNSRRLDRNLDQLGSDNALISAAREHARNMARNGYIAHEDPKGRMPVDRVQRYDSVGENCAKFHGWDRTAGEIASQLLDQWMKSKVHRENILRKEVDKMGAGIWKSKRSVYAVWLCADSETKGKFSWLKV